MSKLAFTCGDPAGVGPEIIEAWLAAHVGGGADSKRLTESIGADGLEGRDGPLGRPPESLGDTNPAGVRGRPSGPSLPSESEFDHSESERGFSESAFVSSGAACVGSESVAVIGPAKWLARLAGKFGPASPEVEYIAVGPTDYEATLGTPDETGARVALAAMELAAAGCREGRFAGVVTGPISKARLAEVGFKFPGQTEFFADRWSGEPVMAFCGGKLRVVLLTWHIPLMSVASALTFAAFERTVRAADALVKADGIAQPRIAVCGLNPHAGEGGLLGSEEMDTIDPILDGLRGEFPGLSRALSGDTAFARQLRGEFDAVVALYHDQGLAPLKVIDFDEAVNVTLGLTFVRTSPDHGTAFGIAGKGVASATSFTNAVTVARKLIAVRAAG